MTRSRLYHKRKIFYECVDVLMKDVSPPSHEPVPVFHRHRSAAPVMVLHRSYTDQLCRPLESSEENGPIADQIGAGHCNVGEKRFPWNNQIRPGTLGSFGDAAERKTAFRIIDRIVGNSNCRCACLQAQPRDFGKQLRVSCGAKGRGSCESGIYLYQDPVASFYVSIRFHRAP